jgi:hypothetical protein
VRYELGMKKVKGYGIHMRSEVGRLDGLSYTVSWTELFSPAVFRIFWSGGGGGVGVQAGAPRAILCPATQGRRSGSC